jgi:hypothetical protein
MVNLPRHFESAQEAIDGLGGHGFGFGGQVGREGGGRGRVVSQGVLDEAQMHACFEQMRGPRVAQRVHRGALVEAACLESGAKGVLHTVPRHGCGGR